MPSDSSPVNNIEAIVRERVGRSDQEILEELYALPALADENDACWNDESYWTRVAERYLAFAEIARTRRLRGAVRPLLDRACYGDPGEIMRGLRHYLEGIMEPDWSILADICMDAVKDGRPGTVLWAVNQLIVLEDERARPLLTKLSVSEDQQIAEAATSALWRLDNPLSR